MLSCHINNFFLNIAIPLSVRDIMGWVLLGLAVLNILGNLSLIVKNSVYDVYKNWSRKWKRSKAHHHFREKMRFRKFLTDSKPKEFAEFELERDFLDAIRWTKAYLPHRRWL
jgi:hypothetical protein